MHKLSAQIFFEPELGTVVVKSSCSLNLSVGWSQLSFVLPVLDKTWIEALVTALTGKRFHITAGNSAGQ